MPKLSLIRNACPSLQPSGDKCTFSLRSGPTGRNGISGSHLSHGHPRTARHGPRRKGDARFLYYLFSVFYVNPFKERRPRGHTARLRAKADAKVAQKRRTAKKTGDFFGPEGESFRKNRQNGGREGNGAPCHIGPTRDGGRSAEGAYSAKHWKMRKRITRRKGPCRAERGRKREGTAKGARRRRKRAAPGKPEGPDGRPARALPNRREAPTGEEREGKGKGEGARAPPPPALQR